MWGEVLWFLPLFFTPSCLRSAPCHVLSCMKVPLPDLALAVIFRMFSIQVEERGTSLTTPPDGGQ